MFSPYFEMPSAKMIMDREDAAESYLQMYKVFLAVDSLVSFVALLGCTMIIVKDVDISGAVIVGAMHFVIQTGVSVLAVLMRESVSLNIDLCLRLLSIGVYLHEIGENRGDPILFGLMSYLALHIFVLSFVIYERSRKRYRFSQVVFA